MAQDVEFQENPLAPSQALGSAEVAQGAAGSALDVLALLTWLAGTLALAWGVGPASRAGGLVALVGVVGSLVLVLLIHRLRREPWSALGLVRPRSWLRLVGLALLATAILKGILALVAGPLVGLLGGEPPDTSRFAVLRGNLTWLLGALPGMWVTAAFIEEVVYRGFLLGRLARVFGSGRGAWIAALLVSNAIFGAIHFYQGVSGVVLTGLVGVMLGAVYLLGGRNLWLSILVHGFMNTVSFVLIYLGLDA